MLFSPRIRLKPLAQLCHRLDIATGAGIKDFKIWQNESTRGSRTQQRKLERVVEELSAGKPLPQALKATGNYFPPLFHQMVEVGDVSGQLDLTFKRLAEHYEHSLAAKRAFVSQLAWPALQFAIAATVVGVLILIMGMLPGNKNGQGFDILGLGLIGVPGFIKYVNFLVLFAVVALLLFEAFRRGAAWIRPLQLVIVRLPAVGHAFKTLALARLTWAFQLVLGTSMDLRRALPLVLQATGNYHYSRYGSEVAMRIEQGQDIHASLAATGVFPRELLDTVAVGEQSGRLAEVMQRLSTEYQDRAKSAITVLSRVAGIIIWLLVAALIITLIVQIFSSYVGALNDAANMKI